MGIPRFARWMTNKYKAMVLKGDRAPRDVAALYVDMNGLIHPCCHGENPELAAASEDDKIRRILAALDEMVADVTPTTLLYLAMDGVAPRAKMNQQRARRYSAAAATYPAELGGPVEDADGATVENELRAVAATLERNAAATVEAEAAVEGLEGFDFIGEEKPRAARTTAKPTTAPAAGSSAFDSNCISPGTMFMTRVSEALQSFVQRRLREQPDHWAPTLAVVVSDSNCPGEGEHKIIDFMRTQVAQGHLKNIPGAHVIVGLDADLILLGMSLHRKDVFILRDNDRSRTFEASPTQAVEPLSPHGTDEEEDDSPAGVSSDVPPTVSPAGRSPTVTPTATPSVSASPAARAPPAMSPRRKKPEYFDLTIAADLLASEIVSLAANLIPATRAAAIAAQPYRAINDFIVLASMLGNDFMPRLPSGHCGDGAMDNFIECYVRAVLPEGFLTTEDGEIDLAALSRWLDQYQLIEANAFRQFMCKSNNSSVYATAGRFPAASDSEWIDAYRVSTGFDNETRRRAACKAYVDGLRFVWRYYSTTSAECPWRWYYPFHYGPLAADLAAYVHSVKHQPLVPLPVQADAPEPFAQLLCILPPTSCRLLPKPLQPVMVDPPPELQPTFPLTWSVDEAAAGGLEHLFTVCLPFADLERLQATVQTHVDALTPAERVRNTNTTTVRCFLRSDNPNLSTDMAGVPQYRWIRESQADAQPAEQGVAALSYQEQLPKETRAKPRQYALSANRFIPSAPKAILEPHNVMPAQRRWPPNERGLHIVDAVALTLVAALAAAMATGASLGYLLELVALGGIVALTLVVLGVGDDSDAGSAQRRNLTRDSLLDWLCPSCTCLNFGRNEACFACDRPFVEADCSAVYSGAVPRYPPVMDPDHTKYIFPLGIEVPGWLAATAKGLISN